MPAIFRMPAKPSYTVYGGFEVYYVSAQHKTKRTLAGDVQTFILHDTGGRDSRQELYDSPRRVSVHYLIGNYPDVGYPCIIKFASERDEQTYGAGFGKVGGIPHNLNETAVQFEIELDGMSVATRECYAAAVASSLLTWSKGGKCPVLVPHWLVDGRKQDARLDWSAMMSRIYQIYREQRALTK